MWLILIVVIKLIFVFFFFKQKTAYEVRISDWSSDVCSSDLSTVFDFADLRSALKDYLELRGCRVLASEFTDFTHPLDKHSYEACLAAIGQADLFVLFIGRRVGGWYDELNRISITRAEYRHAYELAKAGKIGRAHV